MKKKLKKFIPAFLAGVFALTGTGVLANNIIETAEFSNTQLKIIDWELELDTDILSVRMSGSDNTYKFIPLEDLLRALDHDVQWNSETNTLEITEPFLAMYQEMRELHPILEPIDMDNINLDEWISYALSSVMDNRVHMNVGHVGVLAELNSNIEIPYAVDIDYWFENYFDSLWDGRIIFTSVIGCNAEQIRSILHFNEMSGFNLYFNIQDIIDYGLLSDEEIERIPKEVARQQKMRAGLWDEIWTEEELRLQRLDGAIGSISMFSSDRLDQLADIIRLQLD